MTIYEMNKKAVEARAELQLIDKIETPIVDNARLQSETALDGSLYTILTKTDADVCCRLNSTYSPRHEAAIWGSQPRNFPDNSLILFYGLSNGYFCNEYRKNMPKDSRMVIYEPSPDGFFHTLENFDVHEILEDPRVFLGVKRLNEGLLGGMIGPLLRQGRKDCTYIVCCPYYDELFPVRYQEFIQMAQRQQNMLALNRGTNRRFHKVAYRNTIHNLPYLENGLTVKELSKTWPQEVPVIIVGAGPSLDKNIEQLKRVNHRAIVMALDSSLRAVFRAGIKPDILITVEPDKPLSIFQTENCKEIPMICRENINPELLNGEELKGRHIFCKEEFFMESIYKRIGMETSKYHFGGGVGTAAFAVAAELGCRKVILMGQDLAYSETGTAHTSARNKEFVEAFYQNPATMVEGYYGGMVQSREDWCQFRNWFSDAIASVEGKMEVINATEGGASIPRAKQMTLSQAIDELPEEKFDFETFIQEAKSPFDQDKMGELKSIQEQIEREQKQIKVEAAKGIEKCLAIIIDIKNHRGITVKAKNLSKEIVTINDSLMGKLLFPFLDQCREAINLPKEQRYHAKDVKIEEYLNMYYDLMEQYEGISEVLKLL